MLKCIFLPACVHNTCVAGEQPLGWILPSGISAKTQSSLQAKSLIYCLLAGWWPCSFTAAMLVQCFAE